MVTIFKMPQPQGFRDDFVVSFFYFLHFGFHVNQYKWTVGLKSYGS